MADDLTALANWAEPLLAKLDAGARRQLARHIAQDLRRSQAGRIADQKNPDGSPYAPRKLRHKQGRIKRQKMFIKLRQRRHLKARVSSAEISVGFFGRVARIARVHQYGLRDRVAPDGPQADYEQRELIGFTREDRAMIEARLLEYLAPHS